MSHRVDTSLVELGAVLAKLDQLHGLSDKEWTALVDLPWQIAEIAPHRDIVREADPVDRCAIILEGMAYSYKSTGGGGRQILSFHLAGDMPDLQSLHLGVTDFSIAPVGSCRIGFVPHSALRETRISIPRFERMLWCELLLNASILREWLLNVGRREAIAKLAHLVCEMVERHRIAGLTTNFSCNLPITQTMLADALGLSAVHINRVIQELRGEGLILWENRHLMVRDWNRLCVVADFDPAYLRRTYVSAVP